MKRFIFSICLMSLILTAAFLLSIKPPAKKSIMPVVSISPTKLPTRMPVKTITKTVFVPYWTMDETNIDSATYNRIIYFGITPNKQGIDQHEIGYKSLDNFIRITNYDTNRLLGVRMTTTDLNQQVLDDKNLQKKIIAQSIQVAKEKGFDGVVLDFEISALGFESVTKKISDFEITFADTVKQQHLSFLTTLYGDTFARLRPFDVKTIAAHSDGILIMAYDFHKANGNSGPNFPLKDNQDEGYDFQTMITDFLQQVPPEKISVVFGLFGYDWVIDDKGNSLGPAVSLSDYKIQQKFLNACSFTNCNIIHDPTSAETKITYTDADKKNHIVWFEDMRSVTRKTDFLKSKDISSIAYWAYSYF